MIYAIVAIDDKRGLANDSGIPWDLPSDRKHYRDKTKDQIIMMGYQTYREFKVPPSSKETLVATSKKLDKPGFTAIADPITYLSQADDDVWVIGGAGLFQSVWETIDTLYLTRVHGDFDCTKFLPDFSIKFRLVEKSQTYRENNIDFHFEVWQSI
jgi:dihydrofolate reductase